MSNQPVNPDTCRHHLDFDKLVARKTRRSVREIGGGGERIAFAADCAHCGALVSLDSVLTHVMHRIMLLEAEVEILKGSAGIDAHRVSEDTI